MDDLRLLLTQMERAKERDLLKQRADEVATASSGAKSAIIVWPAFLPSCL